VPPARWSRHPAVLAGALGTVLAADLALAKLKLPWLTAGLADEPAHLATALLVYANLPAASREWTAAFAAGAVAPDVDHVPIIPRRHSIRMDEPRPALHTLLAPAVVGAVGVVTRARAREALLGLTAGICAHFLRDLWTGTGLSPVQPASRLDVKGPVHAYHVGVTLLAWRAWRQ
jgi:inner membrane protein